MSTETIVVLLVVCVALVLAAAFVLRSRAAQKPKEEEDLPPEERLRRGLAKTRGGLLDALRQSLGQGLDEDIIAGLEGIFLSADIGVAQTEKLLDELKAAYKGGTLKEQAEVVEFIKSSLVEKLGGAATKLKESGAGPTVILVAGVNGAGKTTSIAKLTHYLANKDRPPPPAEGEPQPQFEKKKILLAPSDTFRAAAIDQLRTWAERLGVEIVKAQPNQDPASVAHTAAEMGKARGFDYVIVDTAGRLHTDKNLMAELEKIARQPGKHIADAPHEVLLVLDATTGQNAVRQAKAFTEAINVTGLIVAKLDGTAKGGMITVIKDELGIPVKFVGLGEQPTDFAEFDAKTFVDALLPV